MSEFLFWGAIALIIFHHLFYPLFLQLFASAKPITASFIARNDATLPTIALVIPAYMEEDYIEMKMLNIASLHYPREKLELVIASDGSTDKTVEIAMRLKNDTRMKGLTITIHDFQMNRGKVAVLNDVLSKVKADIIALTDVSAHISQDCLLRAAAHFKDDKTGVVCATYQLGAETTVGERAYWSYQTIVKMNEAKLAAPMGAHGALYFFRHSLWQPLESDTINDDFILPMRIVQQGFTSKYDLNMIALELEPTRLAQDFQRRIRISAGNMQQALRLISLGSFAKPGLAFTFLGGKFLRAFMPFIFVLAFILNGVLAFQDSFYLTLFALHLGFYFTLVIGVIFEEHTKSKLIKTLFYIYRGHYAGLIGGISYFLGFERSHWIRNRTVILDDGDFIPPSVRRAKRVMDIACAFIILGVFAITYIPVAIAIKLTSKGPVFFRQIRVGLSTQRETKLFYLIKYRSMFENAEAASGAVWASKGDPRVTKIGAFLRKTRLDELPQALNVLRGEMSIVGPRPERPSFFAQLEQDIPFFSERVCNLKPGITGLAQVEVGYPTTLQETRAKVMLDHAYAIRISQFWNWFKTDVEILFQTVGVVVLKKGH